jgi:hypothetical protein
LLPKTSFVNHLQRLLNERVQKLFGQSWGSGHGFSLPGVDKRIGLCNDLIPITFYLLECTLKKRTISAEASGPFGSVKEPLELPPDQA